MPPERDTSDVESRIDSMFGTSIVDEGDTTQGTGDGTTTQPTADTQQEADGGQTTPPSNADGQRDTGAGTRPNGKRGKEQPADGQAAQGNATQQRRLPAAANGDLVDPASGQVIARAGNERRFYEAARTAQGQAARVRGELEQATAQLTAYREAAALPTSLGLGPQEVAVAMHFMAHWKTNPVEAAKKVLTELRAMGHEVEGLSSQVDMGALRQMVNDAIAPFVGDRQTAQAQREASEQADRELSALYSTYPWARGQQAEISNLLESDATLTLREATLMLQSYALQHGYDLHKPLREQIMAAQNGGAAQPQRPNNARVPAPSVSGDVGLTPRRTNTSVGHDRSTRDIVREAMREANMNVDNL